MSDQAAFDMAQRTYDHMTPSDSWGFEDEYEDYRTECEKNGEELMEYGDWVDDYIETQREDAQIARWEARREDGLDY